MVVPKWLKELTSIPDVKDVLLYGNCCQIDRGQGLEIIRSPFRSDTDLSKALMELAFEFGARLDVAMPVADLTVENLRLHMMLPFGVARQSSLSVRVHQVQNPTLQDLLHRGMFDESQMQILKTAIEEEKTVVICGATSSGKTTLLRALLGEVNQRVITIEQIPELFLPFPALSLIARPNNQEGIGEVTLSDLVVQSLRMRPDRVVVGEVRRDEFLAFMEAASNGHRGSLTTLHATSVEHISQRLIVLGLLSGMSAQLTKRMVTQSVDIFLQLERTSSSRKLTHIVRPELEAEELRMVKI